MFPRIVSAVILSVLWLHSAANAAEPVVNPWVSTNRSPNTYDVESLAESIRRGADTPQERAVNFYRFYRRTMFPYSNRNEYPYPENDQSRMFDFIRMVNIYGCALCTQGNWMFAGFLKQSGLADDARGISVPGHGTAEAFWDGKWHFMDAVVGCFAYTDEDKSDIASIDQIIADSTLLSRARQEGRASMPFCPWDGVSFYPEGALAVPDQWYTYRKYALEFLLKTLPDYKPASVADNSTHTMAFNLRPGFKLTRMWDHLPGMYNLSYDYYRDRLHILSPSPALLPPHHPDGGKEKRDEINWPIFKQYPKTINGRDSYRYYANGRLTYSDNFNDDRILAAADSIDGLRVNADSNWLENAVDSTGEVSFTFELPYVFVGGTVSGRVELVEGGWAAVYVDVGNSEQWVCLGVQEKGGNFSFPIPAVLLDERYEFGLKVKLHGADGPGSARLLELDADAVCQLNMYSLPYLAPGANEVTVSAGSIPADCALKVTWRWQELGWDREHTQVVDSAPRVYRIDVPGKDYPRMKEIVMEAAPR